MSNNRVTLESMLNRIVMIDYRIEEVFGKSFMRCYFLMDNDYVHVGSPSVCVDEENFDVDIGKEISYENSLNELWRLEGYRLMSEGKLE